MDDSIFRMVLGAGFAAFAPVGIYHRLQAHTGERLDRRQEGWFILATLRPLAGLRLVVLLAYLIAPSSVAWCTWPLPTWLRWIGVAIGAAAIGLLLATFRALGRNLTDTVVTRREATLVTRGPYRWVRHPFYVSFALGTLADSLAAANWMLLLTGASLVALLVIRTRREEAFLVARFGDEYRRYQERTGRFVPRWKRCS